MPSAEIQGVEQQRSLAVYALDIDHFKQVNDSHGHLYGDQVLKTFGRRLERASEDWMASGHAAVRIFLGHPSGEEFLVIVLGVATREQLVEFGNFLRGKIDGEPLPSETEWGWLGERDNISILVPPPVHERTITTSVGMALYSSSLSGESPRNQVSQLLDQADTALYRAKAGGRNQVIAFDDILASCGRVLEQDVATKIVAIDIGKNVGVIVGQEFRVFPPTFSGTKKFQISDGRSTRTIGTYPRHNITRITVFDVQAELSFAFISDPSESGVSIEVGSHLEAIPLGSIGHLLPHASKYLSPSMDGVKVGDIDAALVFIEENHATDAKPYAIVVRFTRADQYLKLYGPAALNAALARLFRDATARFHAAAAVRVLDSASILIVGRSQTYHERILTDFVEELGRELPELALVAGVFCEADGAAKPAGHASLSTQHALEFARFAASDYALTARSRVTHFNHETAFRILNGQREARAYSQAFADFEKLRSLGVENANLCNVGGLVCSAQRRAEQAGELFERAATLDENIVYKSNFATVATSPGQIERALKLLAGVPDVAIDELASVHPFGYFSYARHLAKAKLEGHLSFDPERFARIGPKAASLPDFANSPARELILKALSD